MLKITLAMISIQMCLYKRSVYEEKLTDIFPQRLSNDKSFFCQRLLATFPFYLGERMQHKQEAEARVIVTALLHMVAYRSLGTWKSSASSRRWILAWGWVCSIDGMVGLEVGSLSGYFLLLCSADVLTAGQGGSHTASWPFLYIHWTLLPTPKSCLEQPGNHTCTCTYMSKNQQSLQDLCPSQGSLGPLLRHCRT